MGLGAGMRAVVSAAFAAMVVLTGLALGLQGPGLALIGAGVAIAAWLVIGLFPARAAAGGQPASAGLGRGPRLIAGILIGFILVALLGALGLRGLGLIPVWLAAIGATWLLTGSRSTA